MRGTHTQLSRRQCGLTLVELMVALVLGSMVVLAAVAALTVARQGFNAVDATAQLRDNGRFAAHILRQTIVQAGFLDVQHATSHSSALSPALFKLRDASEDEVEPPVKGFNDAQFAEPLAIGVSNTVSKRGINGSDMLVVRFQPGSVTTADGESRGDGAMVHCNGVAADYPPTGAGDRMVNVFHVANSRGESALMCSMLTRDGYWDTQPLIHGVETLQFLYGVAGVAPGAAPGAAGGAAPERYLRADQLVVKGSDSATNANWKRVRSIRVGLVLLGPPGSAPQKAVPGQHPLGAPGLMDSASDKGSAMAGATDGRLRQSVSFTIHLRNRLDLM
ncbi:PilW family protein [Melaminivora sp.]|uniref:PilW family protein n=1 Tax=Melaminivora sp. TaxID=1933032 RepID=UPI0028B0D0B4|nr:PilW family protein [Melaminivora sp.]